MSNIGRDLLNVPMGEMIREMAFAIADAQYELDQASVHVAQMMGGRLPILDDSGNITGTEDTRVYFGKDEEGKSQKLSMMELGFSPTFYQFTNNIIEVKIAIKMSREIERTTTTNSSRDNYKKAQVSLVAYLAVKQKWGQPPSMPPTQANTTTALKEPVYYAVT